MTSVADRLEATDDEDLTPDPEPGYATTSLKEQLFGAKKAPAPKAKPAKAAVSDKPPTVSVRRDIRGKLAMFLGIIGTGWASRDDHCGGTFLDSIADQKTESGDAPGIATALTDIICDSPDMVAWFTSSGSYMKWLTLATAVQPVLTTIFAHHVTHSIVDDSDDENADWTRYGAS